MWAPAPTHLAMAIPTPHSLDTDCCFEARFYRSLHPDWESWVPGMRIRAKTAVRRGIPRGDRWHHHPQRAGRRVVAVAGLRVVSRLAAGRGIPDRRVRRSGARPTCGNVGGPLDRWVVR